ncbi:endospore germination permease [Paenibacillus hodogayensis]|uniref:Endospore germination permease n=1 Tax=Paenibacillus hodogayensis TaxID=279208 RepID=A0ABV5W6L6_9BACL
MRENGLAGRQFFIMTFGLTVGTSILVTPAGLAGTAGGDAWLSSLVSLMINMAMVALYIVLTRLYPGRTLFEIHEAALGTWAGKALTLLYLFYFLILAGTLLGNLGFFLSSEIMPETPIEAIQILFLAAVVMCARLGIVVLARVGELMFPWVIVLFLFLALALLPQIDWNHIKPVLEKGWAPVVKAGLHSAMFQELVVLLMFIPLVREGKKASHGYLAGTALGSLMLSTVVLLSVLVLGVQQSANSTFPAFALAKTINIGNFLQRVEGLLITIWVLTFFMKTMLLFFSMLKGFQTLCRLKSYQPLVYPLAMLVLVIAWNTYINTVYVGEIIQKVWSVYSMLHVLVIPLAIAAIGAVRKRLTSR